MKNRNVVISLCALLTMLPVVEAQAMSTETAEPKQQSWAFDGMFGKFDKVSAQRGFQVYKQVCAACHSMHGISYRNLGDIGFSEAEIKAIAAEYKVQDGPNDAGEMFERPARASDKFVSPFANENAARAANGGAYPPDLTLIVKARHDGANYLYSLLTGFESAPTDFHLTEGKYYNPYFPGAQIGMPPPLTEGAVTYQDGTVASVDQMAQDVVNFLQWVSEPEMEQRKMMGLKVLGFLVIAAGFMYAAMNRIWAKLKK